MSNQFLSGCVKRGAFNHQIHAEQAFDQRKYLGNSVQYFELSGKFTFYHVERQGLYFQMVHHRFEAEQHDQGDQKHHGGYPEQRHADSGLFKLAEEVCEQICTANQADVVHVDKHVSSQHASQLFVWLRVEQHGGCDITDGPQAAHPGGDGKRGNVMAKIFHGHRLAQAIADSTLCKLPGCW